MCIVTHNEYKSNKKWAQSPASSRFYLIHRYVMAGIQDTTEISELCHQTKEPVFITKNGYGNMVVMSMETYEKSLAKLELYEKLTEAEAQINNGEELLDGDKVFKDLKEKYGRK